MKGKQLGIRYENIETTKLTKIKLPKETADYLNSQAGKPPYEYIKEYLNDNKLYIELSTKYIEYVNKTLPKEVRVSCQWCNGDRKNEDDKKCSIYQIEAQTNFFFASYEFVVTVEKNKHLIKDKKIRKSLTLQFYDCFAFSNGRVLFDLEKMAMLCLKAGFLSLSKIFANNTALQNLSIINNTIDKLNDEELDAEMFNKEKSIYLEPQKKFFENKQKYYEKQHFIDTENNKQIGNPKCEPQQDSKFSILEWATIFYYADETKLLPKHKFIKERMEQFIKSHNISTTFKSFKSKYHTAKNRINKNNNYPIDKLELILPFLKKNYNQTVTKVENDIMILENEKSEYQ